MTDHTSGGSRAGADELREQVRVRYAAAALTVTAADSSCCTTVQDCHAAPTNLDELSPDETGQDEAGFGADGLDAGGLGASQYGETERAGLPAAALAASLGCGNPLAVADPHDGDTVLDLGSGGGIDVLLSARRVGPTGKAYGLDMTEEMLALARSNAAQSGATNVEFLKGHIEAIPLPDASVDVAISNCVINLSPDKSAVFASVHRVLRPGGWIGLTDVVADDHLTRADRAARGDHASCIAGALTFTEYRHHLSAAGFCDITIIATHPLGDGLHSAIIKASKP